MKNYEWKAMGRVVYGSRKTAFFEEKKENFAARLNCTTHHFDAAANWIDERIQFNLTANASALSRGAREVDSKHGALPPSAPARGSAE
jgi:hypothetical protein